MDLPMRLWLTNHQLRVGANPRMATMEMGKASLVLKARGEKKVLSTLDQSR